MIAPRDHRGYTAKVKTEPTTGRIVNSKIMKNVGPFIGAPEIDQVAGDLQFFAIRVTYRIKRQLAQKAT